MKLVKSFRSLVFAIAFSVLGISALAQKAGAETLTNRDMDRAITINSGQSLDGYPVVASFSRSYSDPNENFRVLNYGSYNLLQLMSNPNLCVNANRTYNNGPVNTWPCNSNDPDQQLVGTLFNGTGIGTVQSRKDPNYCLNLGGQTNPAPIFMYQCNGTWPQIWKWENAQSNFDWKQPAVQTRTIQLERYEMWMVARKYNGSQNYSTTNLGHAWIATVRYVQFVTQTYQNGSWVETQRTPVSNDVSSMHTFSHWPDQINYDRSGTNQDIDQTKQIIANNRLSDGVDFAIRKALISKDLASRISGNIKNNVSACTENYYVPFCPCTVDVSRLWQNITGENISLPLTPNDSVDLIRYYNQVSGTDFVNGGQQFN